MSSNLFSLAGKRVLITGATGGIGAATARACASLGAELVLADVAAADRLAAELRGSGAVVRAHRLDTSKRAMVEALVRETGRIDAAVDCAGYFPTSDWLADPDWDAACQRVIEINLFGPLNLARAVMPGMIERKEGRIVLVGSIAGRNGGASPSTQAHYVMAKGGVHALVRWLSRRCVQHGVLVNGVAPGPVDTPMNAGAEHNLDLLPMRRMGRPEEIGWPIAFLCSPASGYMSGAVIDINGGNFVG